MNTSKVTILVAALLAAVASAADDEASNPSTTRRQGLRYSPSRQDRGYAADREIVGYGGFGGRGYGGSAYDDYEYDRPRVRGMDRLPERRGYEYNRDRVYDRIRRVYRRYPEDLRRENRRTLGGNRSRGRVYPSHPFDDDRVVRGPPDEYQDIYIRPSDFGLFDDGYDLAIGRGFNDDAAYDLIDDLAYGGEDDDNYNGMAYGLYTGRNYGGYGVQDYGGYGGRNPVYTRLSGFGGSGYDASA